ncbi:MAG TPA: apolipoprotein N-acyltransferase [Stellaceae bacterium]|nr:apolipoprotein N-acyltransferase [Stellaceae bacterium]
MPDASALRVPPGARIVTPLCRLAQDCAALTGWRRYGLAFLLGVVLAGTLPPVDLPPLLFVAFPGLLWLDDGSRGFWASLRLGYAFGLGFFVAGMYWIAGALLVDIDDYWWALPFAVMGIPAVLALLPALAMGVARTVGNRLALSGFGQVFLFAVAWSAAEWVRGHALTGLPWNLVGYAWSGGFPGAVAMLQSAAVVGIYGLSFITVLAAALPALLGVASFAPVSPVRRWAPAIVAALLILIPAAAGAVRLALSARGETGVWLRLVQPSIAQTLKWDPAQAEGNFRRLLELSAPAQEGGKEAHSVAAVLWPEAASTFLLGRDAIHRRAIAAVAPADGYVITGTLRAAPASGPPTQFWNSIEAIDAGGRIVANYDKAHLVPFGEYMPLREWLPFKKLTAGTIDLSAGPGPRTLSLPHLPPFAPLICYEAIFPGAVVEPGHRPDWILNVTNDAWYGRSSGPYQHFAAARTRAVEEGLPLIRVANNGISGVIASDGRVLGSINLDVVGYADVELPAPGAATPYARVGDWSFLFLLVLGCLPVAARLRA